MSDLDDLLKSWVFQTTGEINRYNPDIHPGTQPVRIIHYMLVEMFRITYPGFHKRLRKLIDDGKLNNELGLIFGEEPVKIDNARLRTPRINITTRQIEIHETFLSFLWCSTYSVFVRYVETIDYPRINKIVGEEVNRINPAEIEKAKELFDYAKYIIMDFQEWDKRKLPNPEIYDAENRNYVEQASIYYTEAVKFILCHELTHITLHIDQINKDTPDSHYLAFEYEADNNAIDMMLSGLGTLVGPIGEGQRLFVEHGIIFGILSMFFFNSTTTGIKHPNAEDRLTNALERLQLPAKHSAWGIACVGLQMWDEQFGLNLEWNTEVVSYKEQYFLIISQIKSAD